jgi:large subunit ribosomal protein L17
MRHGVKTVKLGRDAAHRKAMLKNLATSIIKRGVAGEMAERQVKTTVHKAKAVRPLVERLITYAKKGDLTSRRQAAKFVQEAAVLQDLFTVIGPRYKERAGGYTRILKLSDRRHGDNADMALVALVEDEFTPKSKDSVKDVSVAAPVTEQAVAEAEVVTEEVAVEEIVAESATEETSEEK